MLKKILLVACISPFLLMTNGCVSKGTFELMENEAKNLEQMLGNLQEQHNQLGEEKTQLNADIQRIELEKADLAADNRQLGLILEAKSDSLSEIITDLRQTIADMEVEQEEQIRADEQKIDELSSKGAALQDELENLVQAKEQEAKALSSTYEELLSKMKTEIDKGQVTISELEGKLTVNMVDAVLFDSGKAEVKDAGLQVLQKVVDILMNVTDKAIRVEGHTDNVKIGGVLAQKYPTNWELSATRAVNVTRFLQNQGLNPADLGAVAYGEHKPVADNETAEGKAKNRRIEIILVAKE